MNDTDSDTVPGCPFCQIVQDDTAAFRVQEDDLCVSFLDRRPVFFGHTLLIPKVHYATLADIPTTHFSQLMTDLQLLARAMERGLQAQGAFIALNYKVSQSVPHMHWHIVPRRHGDGLRGFLWPRQHYLNDAHMQEVGLKLREAIAYVLVHESE